MSLVKKSVSVLLSVLLILTVAAVGAVPGTVKTQAAGWNGYNYGGGTLYGSSSFLEVFGIDYDEYMNWMDTHDMDSANPNYYLGTPYEHNDHRNPRGDCAGARGEYDTPGVAAMNCTGFVWHVLYKSAVASGAPSYKINRLSVMGGVPASWVNYGVNRIWFDSVDDAYDSGVLEKGDLMWLYGTGDNHNAIFYGDSPKDWIYWDSAGERNRYCEVHAIGDSKGLWVAKVTQPNRIELQIDSAQGGNGIKFGTKYMIFDSKSKAQAVINNPDDDAAWDEREGTIVLDQNGHGCFRTQSAPSAGDLWHGSSPYTSHSYFSADAKRVNSQKTYYAVQWSHGSGIAEDTEIHQFTDSGRRTGSGYRIFNFYAPIKVDTPQMTSIKGVSDGIQMKWDAVSGAYKYRVYYKNAKGVWTRLAETRSNSFLDTKVSRGQSFIYTVRCLDQYNNFISGFNADGWRGTYQYLDTPEITELHSTPEGVKITWDEVENTIDGDAVQYRVYYKNSKGGWTRMEQTEDTSYVDDAVGKGKTYTYTVRCVDRDGDFVSKFNSDGWQYTYEGVSEPQLFAESEPDGVRLTWDAVEGVAGYRAYFKSASGEWKSMGETESPEFFDDAVYPYTEYTYSVRCINSKGYSVSNLSDSVQCTYVGVDTPQMTSIENDPEGIRMKWEPVEGAVFYRIYYKNSKGSWVRMAQTAETEYLDTELDPGDSFYYTVRCVNNSGRFMSDYSKTGWKGTYSGVDIPVLSSVKSEEGGVRLTWEPTEGVAVYRLYHKSENGWTRIAEVSGAEYFDTDVVLGTRYTYTIRCANSRGDFISDFSREGWTVTYGQDPQFPLNDNETQVITPN